MKTYIKPITTNAIALLFILFTGTLTAQNRGGGHPVKAHPMNQQMRPGKGPRHQNMNESMMHAQQVIKRTQFVIVKARQAVNKNQNYTGDLARAVAHQKQAKRMFAMKNPHKAILHSKQARMYAFKALGANKSSGDVDQSYQFNAAESATITAEDNALNLDKELEQTTFDDKAVTDKEMTEMEVKEVAPGDYKNE